MCDAVECGCCNDGRGFLYQQDTGAYWLRNHHEKCYLNATSNTHKRCIRTTYLPQYNTAMRNTAYCTYDCLMLADFYLVLNRPCSQKCHVLIKKLSLPHAMCPHQNVDCVINHKQINNIFNLHIFAVKEGSLMYFLLRHSRLNVAGRYMLEKAGKLLNCLDFSLRGQQKLMP